MLRVAFTIVLPLILPTAAYLLWMWFARWPANGAPGIEPPSRGGWAALPWLWLAGSGVLLLALVLYVVTVHIDTTSEGTYVPPRWENGRIVPGHIEPKRNP